MRVFPCFLALALLAGAATGCAPTRTANGGAERPRALPAPQTLQQMLRRTPGVVFRGDGQVRVRGYTDPPTYLVDGVQIAPADVRLLNPADIESIRVLDGADATIYGSIGLNGIISIRTRTPGGAAPLTQNPRLFQYP
ncbi:MAG: TonB-dependent receptor [Rubricoccaceae bacterium]